MGVLRELTRPQADLQEMVFMLLTVTGTPMVQQPNNGLQPLMHWRINLVRRSIMIRRSHGVSAIFDTASDPEAQANTIVSVLCVLVSKLCHM